MSARRLEPRKRYYKRRRITFEKSSSCSSGEEPERRPQQLEVHCELPKVTQPERAESLANVGLLHERHADAPLPVVAEGPRARTEGLRLPPLSSPPPSIAGFARDGAESEYSGHCSDESHHSPPLASDNDLDEETQTAPFEQDAVPPESDAESRPGSGESTEGLESSESDGEGDASRWTTMDATSYLFGIKVKHNVSDNAFSALWDGFRKVLPALREHSQLPSAKTLKRTAMKDLPEMKVDLAYLNTESKEVLTLSGLKEVPKKRFADISLFQPIYEVWRTSLREAVQFHHRLHATEERDVVLNIDGVPIGRTGRSQTIVSIKFVTCRNVYQLVNGVPYSKQGKKMLDMKLLLAEVLKSISDLGLNLKYICADAPMRALLRNQKSHTSKMGCDYCYGQASHKGRPIWGPDTLNSKPRTLRSVLEDYQKISNGTHVFGDFGYNGRSAILDVLPDFDIVENVPVDPMHLFYLGMARSIFELMFNVGEKRPTNITTPRTTTRTLDERIVHIKVPTELPRRPRSMDFKNWKGAEWRHLVLLYFPLVAEVLHLPILRQIWLQFSYLARAYSIPQQYFEALDVYSLKSIARDFYDRYSYAFGRLNLRYNLHLLDHLERIRVHGPFSDISAFPFEGSFAASGRAQKVGTRSFGLQSMRHSYFRPLNGHTCQKRITYSTKTTSRRQDDLIYSENSCYQLVENPNPSDQFLKVKKLNVTTYFAPDCTTLDFTTVGVFKFISTSENVQYLRREKVLGKLVRVPLIDFDVVVTISIAQLREAD